MLQLPIIGAIGKTVSNYTTELIQRPGIIQQSLREGWATLSEGKSESLVCALLVLATTVLLVYYKQYFKHNSLTSNLTSSSTEVKDSNVNKDRAYGEWTPVHFVYPSISACPSELSEIKPIPYRPFRWGASHVTMGIRSMPWDDWIELDNRYESYHRIRAYRIRTRGKKALRVMPDNPGVVRSGGEAAVELVHELAEYLSRRYPTTFHVTRHSGYLSQTANSDYGWDGAPPIKDITVTPLNTTYNLPLNIHEPDAAERALKVAALIVQEDLVLMIEGADGKYYFQAGAICVPGFWRMEDKIGLPLDEIHTSGKVPQYEEKLRMSMDRFFQRLTVDKPVTRNNYFIQVVRPAGSNNGPSTSESEGTLSMEDDDIDSIDPEELSWSTSSNGPEDAVSRAHPVHMSRPMTVTPATLRLRSERQTLRRLPRSGAIVFTIRTYLTPIEDLGREPGVPGRLASAMRGWSRDVENYRGKDRGDWWDVTVGYMDSCWDQQIANGVDPEGTGTEKYPF